MVVLFRCLFGFVWALSAALGVVHPYVPLHRTPTTALSVASYICRWCIVYVNYSLIFDFRESTVLVST